ncbi:hypothetical protein pEaSNUABM14_00167 [Erwinia phage pEa_SNUABM_14]|uniref:J domain-containing protein n=1 Tax=Erwinia phage pEa_SNUABM_7 TaxID=2866695 RepID=A0AAE7WSB3_9CAUD|nr:hypothetical protein MPK74_gp168 [Erwinia phage pEa_SNUABM_7]QYW04492.1 hypothetical protein pEaSNUABM14_00167 [Erwinia phage pEa_SNUABM_14]QYW04836.1 hypothetical protein pEaSNUABM7_00168 [Erwinia phage pEa_SNUABM_7]
MTGTELVVVAEHGLIVHGSTELAEYEDQQAFEQAEADETLEDVKAEADALELRFTADRDRCTNCINKLNEFNRDRIAEVNRLTAILEAHQINLDESDDLEDKLAAEELRKEMEENFVVEDDDEATRDGMNAGEVEATLLQIKCKQVYRKIAKLTHPDRCRNLSVDQRAERQAIFLDAKLKLMVDDLEGLEQLLEKLTGIVSNLNLMQRLLRARQKRDAYRKKIAMLQSSDEWQLYCVAMRYGLDTAHKQYQMGLDATIAGLQEMVNKITNPPEQSSFTHWA